MKRAVLIYLLACIIALPTMAQGETLDEKIRSVKLYRFGDQVSFPAISLGDLNSLELHFDDMDTRIKNYYYTFQLCNADWSPSILKSYDYIKGFQNVRITNYRNSSLSTFRYVHYQAQLPDRTSYPSKSGNYLLKVFLDNDTSQVVFTRRFVVAENKASVAIQFLQPFNPNLFRTGHKINVVVTTDNRIQVLSPNDIKVVILQNNNWQSSVYMDRPTIYRGNYYEYSDENLNALPAGKEFRWIDLRSLRLMSDRMQDINTRKDTTEVFVKPDAPRGNQVYVYYRDVNGSYTVETMESINPFWQGDYAKVHFSYFPPGNVPLAGDDVYMFGEFTNFAADSSGKMTFNPERGAYEKTMILKQGYYNYSYVTMPTGRKGFPDFSQTEGNYYATENSYVVLVYYRPFGARADELISISTLNSAFQR